MYLNLFCSYYVIIFVSYDDSSIEYFVIRDTAIIMYIFCFSSRLLVIRCYHLVDPLIVSLLE
jgi:hypothetical protein